MKTKMMLTGLLISGVVLAANQTAHAEVADTHKGTGNVEVTAGSGTITPNPIKPYPPTGPMLPVGALGISSATDLYFDAISLSDESTTRDALYVSSDGTPISNVTPDDGELASVPTDGSAYAPGYSVTDRRGTGAGWNLALTLGDFTQTDAKSGETPHTLKGATLSFPNATPYTSPDASNSIAPETYQETISAGGSATVLMSAAKDAGMGIWVVRYNSRTLTDEQKDTTEVQPIVLSVPANNYAGKYQATLTWELNDGPLANG